MICANCDNKCDRTYEGDCCECEMRPWDSSAGFRRTARGGPDAIARVEVFIAACQIWVDAAQ
jgi:hypothetical protein